MSELLQSNLFLVLGVIIGLLLNPAKQQVVKIVKHIKAPYKPGHVQFLEPKTAQEKFKEAKDIGDLLDE